MNRESIMKMLDTVAKTFPPATKSGNLDKWIVLMRKRQTPSLASSKGGWLYFDVMCYVDSNSIMPLDGMVEQAKEVLHRNGIELTGVETQDYYDNEMKAFMISFEIRFPKEVK